ncbi:MAG: response regulator [Chitinophagaceae bacterium]
MPTPVNYSAPTCFLIDDDLDDQEIFLLALKEVDENIHGIVAGNGIEALAKLTADPDFIPDHIFLDVNMQKMNGLQCLPEIKKLDHLKNTKVIMFSTTSQDKIVKLCRDLGANQFLVKPASFGLLIEALHRILKG